jgi:O-antigen ligase
MKLTRFFFFATVFCVTFEKLHWDVAGTLDLVDILAFGFIVCWLVERIGLHDGRLPRTSFVVLAFAGAFLLVYLGGWFNLDTPTAADLLGKGLFKFALHFLFLIAAVAFLARRSEEFYWRTLAWFVAGMTVNAIYAVLQLLGAIGGVNLDSALLSPLTGGASSINIYGAVNGRNVYRPNALTGDPNHLGVMLIVPLLVLLPIYLRLERGHRLRRPLVLVLAFLLVVELATLSRSGLLGLACGLAVLALPYRHRLVTREVLVPLAATLSLVGLVILYRFQFFERVIRSRVQTGGTSSSGHFDVYTFIPDVLHLHPMLGLGFNTFSVYYEQVTGKQNWGPHSFYVALLVETGLIGTLVFVLFLWYLFRRLRAARQVGRTLSAVGDPTSARVRPLAWGLTAALVGTLAANAFYLTMTFYYFYVLAALALAAPLVFRRRLTSRIP